MKNSTNNIPKAYKNGYVEFYKLRFKVTPDVLIPRPETELLVDEVLKFIKNYTLIPKPHPLTILDLGTGSGNIAISITKNLCGYTKGIRLIASDVSQKALEVAEQNAKICGVEERIIFIQSDLLSGLNYILLPKPYTLIIVTNLPYIPSARIPYLDSSVKDFEPKIALDGGRDGFELYRKLFKQIVQKGWQPQLIIGEVDYTHGELACLEAQKYFPKAQIEVKKDLAQKQRVLLVRQFL